MPLAHALEEDNQYPRMADLSFKSIPTLSLAAAKDPATKPAFLESLRSALLNVGFLYLADTGLPSGLIQSVVEQCHAFFGTLTDEQKLAIEMKNANSFLGYSRLGNEITAGAADWREQIDLSTPHPLPGPGDPAWFNMKAPNQWPDPLTLPHFRPAYEDYISRMSKISMEFVSLIAEAIGLEPNAFDRFFDQDQQHKLKLVKYPEREGNGQGVGPHKDSMLTSFLLQASPQRGLQAQNLTGEWIDCEPKEGTLVVAIGQGLEAITGGVCASTTHRVLSPSLGSGPRYSIPFFQGVSYSAKFESMDVPDHVRRLKEEALDAIGGKKLDDVEFTFVKGKWSSLGEATLMNRVKSHTDVSERWYPELLAKVRALQAEQVVGDAGDSNKDDASGPSASQSSNADSVATAVEAH
ncbi:hypothetical protein FH972_021894 [Carpinus fangiana]|uniref:Fe2OG dioxygenase domain-containing protein n=1 Tax=Carpinus fangiana TaxID=176857 RepID=A0A5N6KRA6_9ROSI|nr:hypothetical protein FH972_021894 [Carpinus fangiana]